MLKTKTFNLRRLRELSLSINARIAHIMFNLVVGDNFNILICLFMSLGLCPRYMHWARKLCVTT